MTSKDDEDEAVMQQSSEEWDVLGYLVGIIPSSIFVKQSIRVHARIVHLSGFFFLFHCGIQQVCPASLRAGFFTFMYVPLGYFIYTIQRRACLCSSSCGNHWQVDNERFSGITKKKLHMTLRRTTRWRMFIAIYSLPFPFRTCKLCKTIKHT